MTPQLEEAEALLKAAMRDYTAMTILSQSPIAPIEITLFHAQQAAEKLIKDTLAARGINYHRTHDLVELNAIAQRHAIEVPVTEELLTRLSPYAVEFRYAGAQAPHVAMPEATSAILVRQTWAESQLTA